MTELFIDGQKVLNAELIELTTLDGPEDQEISVQTLEPVNQTFTLESTYWKLIWLADCSAPYNIRTSKRIRSAAERYNPLRALGLL